LANQKISYPVRASYTRLSLAAQQKKNKKFSFLCWVGNWHGRCIGHCSRWEAGSETRPHCRLGGGAVGFVSAFTVHTICMRDRPAGPPVRPAWYLISGWATTREGPIAPTKLLPSTTRPTRSRPPQVTLPKQKSKFLPIVHHNMRSSSESRALQHSTYTIQTSQGCHPIFNVIIIVTPPIYIYDDIPTTY